MKKLLTLFFFTLTSLSSFAQEPEMADAMRANGKIYVVVAVVLIVLIGLFLYLFLLDRKITRLERKFEDNR